MRASKLVVISAGAFGSPAILERSGIGAEAVLKQCGIEQRVNLPGVGENYRGLRLSVYLVVLTEGYQIIMAPSFRTLLVTNLLPWTGSGVGRRVLYRVSKQVVALLSAPFTYSFAEHLALWKSNRESLIAQKLAQRFVFCNTLIGISAVTTQKSNGVLTRMS